MFSGCNKSQSCFSLLSIKCRHSINGDNCPGVHQNVQGVTVSKVISQGYLSRGNCLGGIEGYDAHVTS